MEITRRTAKRRGWDGPFRYHLPNEAAHAGFIHGWVIKRGPKWMYFWSISDDRKLRVPLTEERHMRRVT